MFSRSRRSYSQAPVHQLAKGPRRKSRSSTGPDQPASTRLSIEQLEDRRMLAVVTVSNTNDLLNGDTSSIANLIATDGGDGISLREAITAANNTAGSDDVHFNIPGAGPHSIAATSALPNITDTLNIDGTTEPGFAGTPLIVINGSGAGAVDGVSLVGSGADGSTIRELVINGFAGDAIQITDSSSNTILGNFIGTDATGTAAVANGTGVSITGASQLNQIGGAGPADGNIIAGNTNEGVRIQGAGATGNSVIRNAIGVDVTFAAALGNGAEGVAIVDAPGNTIGSTAAGAGNVISGNADSGVRILGNAATGNTIVGNAIGVNAAGNAAIANGIRGITIQDAPNNTVGGTAAGARNIISGNVQEGVLITGVASAGNTLQGNYIGIDVTGTAGLPNGAHGVSLSGAPGNTIGGTAAGARNIVSGNTSSGIRIIGNNATGNVVEGNYIGLNPTGNAAIGNGLRGVTIQDAPGNTVGGAAAGARNLISGNLQEGVLITGVAASGNTLQGNYIGTDATGNLPLGNSSAGVLINNAPLNTVGGTAAGQGNLIAFNGGDGVEVVGATATGNAVRRNSIRLNTALGIDLGNDGVTANDAGDPDAGPNNLQNFTQFVGDATLLGDTIAVTYSVSTLPANASYPLEVEFYLTDADNQEGRTFMVQDTYSVADQAVGNKLFTFTWNQPITSPSFMVATVTDSAGNTSEFSAPVEIVEPVVLGSEPTVIVNDQNVAFNEVDFYQYTAHETGKIVVRSTFIHSSGNIDLEIRDQFNNLIDSVSSSSPTQDFEEIYIPVVTQERYFIHVIGAGNPASLAGNDYDLEIENFPAPVPTGVHLDPASDTGVSNSDGVTSDLTPTFFVQTDVLGFVDENRDGFAGAGELAVLSAAQAAAGTTPGIAVEVTWVNTSDGSFGREFADPVIAAFPEVYTVTPTAPLSAGTYFVTARTVIFDGQGDDAGAPDNQSDRSGPSEPLWITILTEAPESNTINLLPSSDSGMSNTDMVTNVTAPAFFGLAEPNAKVRIFAENKIDGTVSMVGQGVVNTDGTWEVTVEPLADGAYNFTADFEGASGIISGRVGVDNNSFMTAPGLPIPDNSTVTSMRDLTGLGLDSIMDMTVTINIQHAFVSDLDIFLISPDNTRIELTSDNGFVGDDYENTVFDDLAPRSITDVAAADAPFTGRFRPEDALSALDGIDPNGVWTLEITDDSAGIDGTLVDWTLGFITPKMVVIDTVEPNTPFLELLDDTGRSDVDNITKVNLPMVSMTTTDPNVNLAQVLYDDNLKFRIYDRFEDNAEVLIYDSAADGVADAMNDAGDMFTALTQLTRSIPDGGPPLADGLHNLKLEVEDRAGNISHDFLLEIFVDTENPPVSFGLPNAQSTTDGLAADSDSGVVFDPETFADRVTNDTTPRLWGRAEADSIVRVYLDRDASAMGGASLNGIIDLDTDTFLGQAVAVPFDGNDAYPNGYWELETTVDLNQFLNDPDLGLDGLRSLLVTAEDVAGNPMEMNGQIDDVDQLDIFIDTQGPQVSDITVNDLTSDQYDLFDPKPTENGPTPLVDSITIEFIDEPSRLAPDFVYEALAYALMPDKGAVDPGNYQLVGDHVGQIAIDTVTITDSVAVDGAPATMDITLTFAQPLPDDRYTFTISDNLTDPAGNNLDGESNADQPLETPEFPSGDGVPGGDFVGRFTIDARPEIGAYVPQGITLDINGNFVWDPQDQLGGDAQNVDLTFTMDLADPGDGSINPNDGGFGVQDLVFVGEFAPLGTILSGDNAVFVIDVSGSTNASFGGDPVGDQNNDGTSDTILDAEIAAFKLLNQQLVDRGLGNTARVGIAAFDTNSMIVDMDLVAPGVQNTTTPLADTNANGVRDVDEVLMALSVLGSTNFEAGLQDAISIITGDALPNGSANVVFLSDGMPSAGGGSFADEVTTIRDTLGHNLRAFGVGPGASLPDLLAIDPDAERFSNSNELLAAFGGGGGAVAGDPSGFDQLAVYGNSQALGSFRWLIDTNSDGIVNTGEGDIFTLQPSLTTFNSDGAIPVAGNFDGNADNGDEIGLYYRGTWIFDTDRDFVIEEDGSDTRITGNLLGHPIVGDFDGDGIDDLGVFNNNVFSFDLANDGLGVAADPVDVDDTLVWGFPGVLDRPVAADMDQDGIDDLGLWVPRFSSQLGRPVAEWYFLISDDLDQSSRVAGTIVTLDHPYEPIPFGNDLYAEFGDELALPIAGNFDPPVAAPLVNNDMSADQDGDNDIDFADFMAMQRSGFSSSEMHSWEGNFGVGAIQTPAPNGDVDGDGDTDFADLMAIQRGHGNVDPSRADGDTNSDAVVDLSDIRVWESQAPQIELSFAMISSSWTDQDSDGDTDFADLLAWQRTVTTNDPLPATQAAITAPPSLTGSSDEPTVGPPAIDLVFSDSLLLTASVGPVSSDDIRTLTSEQDQDDEAHSLALALEDDPLGWAI